MDKEQFKHDVNRLIDASDSFSSLDPLLTKYMKMVGYRMELIEFLECNEKEEVKNTFRANVSDQPESEFGGFGGGSFGGGGASSGPGSW